MGVTPKKLEQTRYQEERTRITTLKKFYLILK